MQVVPQGLESVNGSSDNMGCTSSLVESGGVLVCESRSYLIDGCSPDIDTSTSDWASQLVTVRSWASQFEKVRGSNVTSPDTSFPHVLLTFGFDTAVSLTGIVMDWFLCPDWGIGAPYITVYLNEDYNLTNTNVLSLPFVPSDNRNHPSSPCDSLSTVTFSGGSLLGTDYHTIHILVGLKSQHQSLEWVHVGKVRFIGIEGPTCLQPTPTLSPFLMSPDSSVSHGNSTRATNFNTISTLATFTTQLAISSTPDSSLSDSIENTVIYATTYAVSSTPDSSPSDQPASFDNTIIFALVAIIAGLIFVASTVTGLVILLVKKHPRSTKAKNAAKTATYKLEKLSSSIDNHIEATNPILSSSMNDSRYVCPDASLETDSNDEQYDVIKKEFIYPSYEAYYDVVALDEPPAIPPTQTGFTESNYSGGHYEATPLPTKTPAVVPQPSKRQPKLGFAEVDGDGRGHYEIIPLPTTLVSPVQKTQRPPHSGESTNAHPNPPFTEDETGGGHYEAIPLHKGAAASASPAKTHQHKPPSAKDALPNSPDGESCHEGDHMYSIIKRRKAPLVPEKSSDLKDYLAVRIFNENIYSESITPSDFISQQPQPEEEILSDPIIYAPIYPSFTELPESFELPAKVDSSNVKEKLSLRTGHYGEVMLADTVGLSLKDLHLSKTETNKNVSVTLAMKKLRLDGTPAQRRAFETEAKFLSQLRHPNVVRLLGTCYEDPAFIMMEYMQDGDLSQFLQKYSEVATPSSTTQITQSTLVYMASQICSGMKHLAALNFIHRDLATRNCLVGKNFSVKVASLGVANNIYESHYFRVQGKMLLPIRWMATECFNGKFSEKSDVWAFGVTMWELFTLAKQLPYRHLSDEEVIHNALKWEYRHFPTRSSSCPESVYELMGRCWVQDFNERITFGELHTLIHTVL